MDTRRTLPAVAFAVMASVSLSVLNLSCGASPTNVISPKSTDVVPKKVAPTPTLTPPPPSTCHLGQGITHPACEHTVSQLLPILESALDRLVAERPGIFDLSNEFAAGTRAYKILDRDAYLDGLVATVAAMGYCAERDVDDFAQQTVRIKSSNEFSEDFDVVIDRTESFIRRGQGAYDQTCTPPNFPAPRDPSWPPVGSGCYRPFPPPLYKMNCKVHLNAGDHHVIDSTPIVANAAYCAAIGFQDAGQCPVRPEGRGDREACENWVVGEAADTGRPGPTWTRRNEGTYCSGEDSGCIRDPNSPYQLWAYQGGWYTVSGNKGGTPCDAFVDR